RQLLSVESASIVSARIVLEIEKPRGARIITHAKVFLDCIASDHASRHHGGRARMFFLISRRSVGYLGIVALGAFCFTSILLWPQPRVSRSKEDGSKQRPSAQGTTFDGNSAELKETIVVPTLDTPLSDGKSVVWCSSFVLAWNRLKHDITKGPVRLRNAEILAERLNQARESQDDL